MSLRMVRFPQGSCDCLSLRDQCKTGYHWWYLDGGGCMLIMETDVRYMCRVFGYDGVEVIPEVVLMKYGFVGLSTDMLD